MRRAPPQVSRWWGRSSPVRQGRVRHCAYRRAAIQSWFPCGRRSLGGPGPVHCPNEYLRSAQNSSLSSRLRRPSAAPSGAGPGLSQVKVSRLPSRSASMRSSILSSGRSGQSVDQTTWPGSLASTIAGSSSCSSSHGRPPDARGSVNAAQRTSDGDGRVRVRAASSITRPVSARRGRPPAAPRDPLGRANEGSSAEDAFVAAGSIRLAALGQLEPNAWLAPWFKNGRMTDWYKF